MGNIDTLSKKYAEYRIYPKRKYVAGTPLKEYLDLYPNETYAKLIEKFLSQHKYEPLQRGADLPWWGESYFSTEKGFRAFIIAQDTYAPHAGSIVFFSHLMPLNIQWGQYEQYRNRLNNNYRGFTYNSFSSVRNVIVNKWELEQRFLFITDGAKVYNTASSKDGDFDRIKSLELLRAEIEICDPDLIIILGTAPLKLLVPKGNYRELVEMNEYYYLDNTYKCVISPFIIGQGITQPNFDNRFNIATELIQHAIPHND